MRAVDILSGTMNILPCMIIAGCIGMVDDNVDSEQQECLAMNIYHEARGESVEGQLAVAHVTTNRVKHSEWSDNICDVVYQPKQFSWTFTIKDQTPREDDAWNQANIIARDVMLGNTTDPTDGAVFYHTDYVNPFWAQRPETKVVKVIGTHIFYTWDGQWH